MHIQKFTDCHRKFVNFAKCTFYLKNIFKLKSGGNANCLHLNPASTIYYLYNLDQFT